MTENYHDKDITIIVNARPKKVEALTLTFNELATLAFGQYDPNPTVTYDVTWSLHKEHGSLVLGEDIAVKEGMIFNVTRSNKS